MYQESGKLEMLGCFLPDKSDLRAAAASASADVVGGLESVDSTVLVVQSLDTDFLSKASTEWVGEWVGTAPAPAGMGVGRGGTAPLP